MTSILSLQARRDVESAVSQFPEVSKISIVDQWKSDGEKHSVAYVTLLKTPSPSEGRQSVIEFRNSRIRQWKTIFDFTYKPKSENAAPDFTGWRSSFTNKDIPTEDMREWVERTCERILSYKPRRILEIGCGVGLLLERLAPHCDAYTATDVSGAAIRRLREFVANRDELQNVTLLERDASNFDGFSRSDFDMVVINSVVQYFPELGYLEQVLSSAIQTLGEGGRVFVGDIRNLSLQTALHTRIQRAKAPDGASVGWLRNRISLMEEQERELVIDPQFFLNFSRAQSGVAGAEVLLKRGRAKNEMTSYRYDAVLHLGAAKAAAPQRTLAWRDSLPLADLIAQGGDREGEVVRIAGVPNARVEADLEAWRLLASAADTTPIATIQEKLDRLAPTGIDPEALFEAAEAAGCDVRIQARPHAADGSFDVTILCRGLSSATADTLPFGESAGLDASRPVSTDPLFAAQKQQMADCLWTALRERLPNGDLPAALQVVDEIPPSTGVSSLG